MKTITLALKTDGTAELVHGPEVPFAEQRATVQSFRDSNVPEGVERVEIWSRNQVVKFAYRRLPADNALVPVEPVIVLVAEVPGSDEPVAGAQVAGPAEITGTPTEPLVPVSGVQAQIARAARHRGAAAR